MTKEPVLMCHLIFADCEVPLTENSKRSVLIKLQLQDTDQIERLRGTFRQRIGRPNVLIEVDDDLYEPLCSELLKDLHEQAMRIVQDDYSHRQMSLDFQPDLTPAVEAIYQIMQSDARKAESVPSTV